MTNIHRDGGFRYLQLRWTKFFPFFSQTASSGDTAVIDARTTTYALHSAGFPSTAWRIREFQTRSRTRPIIGNTGGHHQGHHYGSQEPCYHRGYQPWKKVAVMAKAQTIYAGLARRAKELFPSAATSRTRIKKIKRKG